MSQVAATMKVLESNPEALLGEPKLADDEELVDLDSGAEDSTKDDEKPAAKAPVKKEVAKAPEKPEAPAKPADDEDAALPEPLRGKSKAELARMYQEAHQTIGRQGSELGEFRRKADLLIQASLANLKAGQKPAAPAAPVKEEEIDESEFFSNPKAAIAKAVENHPLVKQLKAQQGQLAATQQQRVMQANAERFHAAHPDAGQILQDAEFRAWVEKSPMRRTMLQRAHERYDFNAGDEVFSTWKELKSLRTPKTEAAAEGSNPTSEAARTLAAAAKAKREAQAKEAAAPTSGGGSAAGGKKKIYRRADILRLMEQDPARYEAMSDEIALAYAEKRVK